MLEILRQQPKELEMIDFSVALPVTAAILHGIGFILYNVQTKLGQSDPNPASWFIWAFTATLNALTFSAMNNPVAALQFFTGSVGCIATFLYVLFIGHFKKPTKKEWAMLMFGTIACIVWQKYTATTANMILAGILFYSFEPTILGVWNQTHKEKPAAWYLWTTAWAITAVSTFVFNGGWTLSMVIPIGLFIGHGLVPVLCARQNHLS